MDATSAPLEPGTSSSPSAPDDNAGGNTLPARAYYAPPTNDYGRLLTVPNTETSEINFFEEESDRSQREIIHRRIFGQTGHIQPERTTAFSWQEPVLQFSPEQDIITVDWAIPLSSYQAGRLLHGFCPEIMEDKWFIYADGPDASGQAFVHFNRSWSGKKMAVLSMKVAGDTGNEGEAWSGCIEQLSWEKEGEGEKADEGCSEGMAKFLVSEVCRLVLQVSLCENLEDPPEWRGLSDRRARYVPVMQTTYRGGTTDDETIEDAQRLIALGKHPEVSLD